MPGVALAEKVGTDEISGLWLDVISAADNPPSFPAFRAFELYGAGTYIGSGQPDLQPGSLSSSAWGIWERTGPRKFRLTARFWTYDTAANPTGFAAASAQITPRHARGAGAAGRDAGAPVGPRHGHAE